MLQSNLHCPELTVLFFSVPTFNGPTAHSGADLGAAAGILSTRRCVCVVEVWRSWAHAMRMGLYVAPSPARPLYAFGSQQQQQQNEQQEEEATEALQDTSLTHRATQQEEEEAELAVHGIKNSPESGAPAPDEALLCCARAPGSAEDNTAATRSVAQSLNN